jgi:hypothetical protein
MNTRTLEVAGAGALALAGMVSALGTVADWEETQSSLAARDRVRDHLVMIDMTGTNCKRIALEATLVRHDHH